MTIASKGMLEANVRIFIETLSTLRGAIAAGYVGEQDGAKSFDYIAKDMVITAGALVELSNKKEETK